MFLGRHCVILPCHKEAPSSHKESAQRIMVANCISSYEVAEFSLKTTIKYGAYDISLRGTSHSEVDLSHLECSFN